MNQEVETLAMAYAQLLIEYHVLEQHCKTSDLQQDKAAFRNARDAMYDAQNALDAACVAAASAQ